MSLLPCSNCKKRPRGKLASVYLAWFSGSERASVKVRLCEPCAIEYAEHVRELKPLTVEDDSAEWPIDCRTCGTAIADDFDPTYLTVYMPSSEPVQLIIAVCGSCASKTRPALTEMGQPLIDRQSTNGVGGGPQAPQQVQAFQNLQWYV